MTTALETVSTQLGIEPNDARFINALVSQRPDQDTDFYINIMRKHFISIHSSMYILLGLCIGAGNTYQVSQTTNNLYDLCQRKN